MFDFNDAPEQRSDELIPAGTTAVLQIKVRPGNAGEGGLLVRSKSGECEMLDLEFTVVDGPHRKRKLWANWVLSGTTSGHETAAEISNGRLRAVLESARGVKPDDMSDAARKKRMADLVDFDGLRFIARIGIEKGKAKDNGTGENYPDRNTIAQVVTPDKKDWHAVEQAPAAAKDSSNPEGGSAPAAITKPAWAV
jgi:hypothetical protein